MAVRIATMTAVLAGSLVLVAGAGARGKQTAAVDLADPSAVNSHVRSIGIDPATVVRQTGRLNYAGPNCPGVRWNCTTSTNVVQVSTAGGRNRVQCAPAEVQVAPPSGTTNACVILQDGPDNNAQCTLTDTKEPTASEVCDIVQDGAHNAAVIQELIEQRTGPNQDARQIAHVHQTATDTNVSQIQQDVKQDTMVGTTQNQNVHQVALVEQTASGSSNFSDVNQNQDLSESGAASVQNQNLAGLPKGISDCDLVHKPGSAPNACANVVQEITSAAGGKNESQLHQAVSETETTTASPASQTQEQPKSGIEGHVDQTNPPGAGTNLKNTQQDARQRAEGGTSQRQIIDPNCCGVGTTVGGVNNMDDFQQSATQSASLIGDALQVLRITGDTNHEPAPGSVSTQTAVDGATNVCRIHHDARNNVASTEFTFTDDSCVGPVTVTTVCTTSSAAGKNGFCTPPPSGDVRVLTRFLGSLLSGI